MSYKAKILCDSISPASIRLTTMEVTFPRIVLAEFNTHRQFSRNSASSRAIPVTKMLQRVQDDPFIPIYWGRNQRGMQAAEELSFEAQEAARHLWLEARDQAIDTVKVLQMPEIDLHKQIANRLLEPWMWQTVIVTATEWDNFFNLRRHKDAQPEIKRIADMMFDVRQASIPTYRDYGQWHLPLVDPAEDLTGFDPVMVCAGRCARVSYLTHDGKRDPKADEDLCRNLMRSGHCSPLEHPALSVHNTGFIGNIRGFMQFRKQYRNEAVFHC